MYCDIPNLGRCCFCMPLRRGVLGFGYLNLLYNAFLVGFFSYTIHKDTLNYIVMYSMRYNLPTEVCIASSCIEIILTALLIYGAHMRIVSYMKGFYYFTITTIVGVVLLQILVCFSYSHFSMVIETFIFATVEIVIQIYLILLVRSLIRKIEVEGDNRYDNPLNQIVTGETKVEPNGVYNDTTTTQPAV